jgi:hypothetical protein
MTILDRVHLPRATSPLAATLASVVAALAILPEVFREAREMERAAYRGRRLAAD